MKEDLFREMVSRVDLRLEEKQFLECSWYIYALLEDRLLSLLRQSGGVPCIKKGRHRGQPIMMFGPKLQELKKRSEANGRCLSEYIKYRELNQWKDERNNLMHDMASGDLTIEDIDVRAEKLATEGRALLRVVMADARRLKKHRK